jgi:hypothetical protein
VGDDEEVTMRQRGRHMDRGDDDEDDEGEDLFNDNFVKFVSCSWDI